jgi:uncharacterized membrane protein
MEVSGFELHARDDHAYSTVRALFDLIVDNTGNHFDHCGLSVDGIPPGWSVTCPARLGLDAYANTTVALIAMPGRSTVAGDYTIGVCLFTEKGVPLQTLSLTATVNQSSSLEFTCPDANQQVERGSDASFGLVFCSQSNFNESLSLAMSGLPTGWGWSTAPDPIRLAPFGGMKATLMIQVPSDSPAGIYILTIGASASGWKKTLDVTVEVLEQRMFSAYLDRCQERLMPGNEGRFVLSLRNTGNCPDSYILSAEGALSARFSRNIIYLDPRSAVTVEIDIGVPDMAPAGDDVMMFTVESARDPTVRMTINVEISVERISRLSLDYDAGSRTGQGVRGGFWLQVSNRGPQAETVRLEALSLSWDAGCPAITVEPGNSRRVLVGYAVPAVLEGGDYEISLIASSEMQSWNITHRVTVPAAPPIQGHTISVSNTSQYSLALVLAAVLALASVAVFMAVWMNAKRRNGKAS